MTLSITKKLDTRFALSIFKRQFCFRRPFSLFVLSFRFLWNRIISAACARFAQGRMRLNDVIHKLRQSINKSII
jgi:hypothetical protein